MSQGRVSRLLQTLLGFYYLEAGLFLVLAPWSRFWDSRVVFASPASLEPLLASGAFRGFVAGLGVLHLALAAGEFFGVRSPRA